MNLAKVESLLAELRAEVGGFTAGMEDHIARLLGKTGSDDPAPVSALDAQTNVLADFVATLRDKEAVAAVETMTAPAEPEAPAA